MNSISQIRTQFAERVNPTQHRDFVLIKEFFYSDKVIKLFQSIYHSNTLFYGAFKKSGGCGKDVFLDAPPQLEIIDAPNLTSLIRNPQVLNSFFSHAAGKVTECSDGQYKLAFFQRGLGGGKKEMALGAVAGVAGIGLAVFMGPCILGGMASGAVMGGGFSIGAKGYSREEDLFDSDLAIEALKGAVGGAATGLIGGGVGGAVVRRTVGVKAAVVTKQAIHAAVNAAGGVVKNGVEAGLDAQFGGEEGKKRAKEKLSTRNMIASAVGGAAGGLAGAHAGKQTAEISGKLARSFATVVAGTAAGGAAGGAGGAAAAVVVNVCKGDKATEGVGAAAMNGASTGMITGAAAAGRVSAKHVRIKDQISSFKKTGEIKLDSRQSESVTQFLEGEVDKIKQMDPAKLRNSPALQEKLKQIQGLIKQVEQGKLTRQGLYHLHDLGGLPELDNPALSDLIYQEMEDQMNSSSLASQEPKPVSNTSKVADKKPVPTKEVAKEKSTSKDISIPNEESQKAASGKKKRLNEIIKDRLEESERAVRENQAAAEPKMDKLPSDESLLKKEAEVIEKKIDALNKPLKTPGLDEEIVNGLVGEVNAQKVTLDALKDPNGAASNVLEQAANLQNHEFLKLPEGTSDQGVSVLYREGNKIYSLHGKLAEEFLENGPDAMGYALQGKGFDIQSNLQKGELFERLQNQFERVQQDYLDRARDRAAEALQPGQLNPNPEPMGSSIGSLFSQQELRRLEKFLNRLEHLIPDSEAQILADAYS